MVSIANCRSCSARIVWATTKSGKKMPVDVAPHPEGNVFLDETSPPRAHVLAGEDLAKARRIGTELRRSHFVTCSNARDWRRA